MEILDSFDFNLPVFCLELLDDFSGYQSSILTSSSGV